MRAGPSSRGHRPTSFQGLEKEGLNTGQDEEKTGLPVVTEVLDRHAVDLVAEYADILQVGRATCRISSFCGSWASWINPSC